MDFPGVFLYLQTIILICSTSMLEKISRRNAEYLIGSLICILAFIVYLITLCPTVNFIDAGELATDIYTLGIAHPTGYPLFTTAGWIFSHLPLGFREIYQINLMAAFFCAAALFFFFRFLVFMLSTISPGRVSADSGSDRMDARSFVSIILPAFFGTLVLGFSGTYWSTALSIEVYPLHVFLVSILLFAFAKAAILEKANLAGNAGMFTNERYWLLFAFVLGLSFTNHMTTILLAPGFLYLYFAVHGFRKEGFRRIVRMAVPFLLGFSLYLYLPIRAARAPVMNWGNPVDFERFFWHFSGKVYRVWIFSSFDSAEKQFTYFINTLAGLYAYFPLVFALLGVLALLKRSKILLIFSLLLFVGCLAYSINYDINDIDSYFLLAYMTIAFWSAAGAYFVVGLMPDMRSARIVAVLLACSPAILVGWNYADVNENDNHIVENYTRDMFASVGENGIILSSQWDYFVSSAYYLQLVEHVRPDIVVIDKELMRRSWYYPQLEHRYPWLVQESKPEISLLIPELNKFERSLPYDPSVIEYRYANAIRSFIMRNYRTRPVYVTQDVDMEYLRGLNIIPAGLAFRVYPDSLVHDNPPFQFHAEFPRMHDKYVDGIGMMYAKAWYNNALVSSMLQKKDEAKRYVDEALILDPRFPEALALRNRLAFAK